MKCISCGAEFEDGSRFCPECGVQQPVMPAADESLETAVPAQDVNACNAAAGDTTPAEAAAVESAPAAAEAVPAQAAGTMNAGEAAPAAAAAAPAVTPVQAVSSPAPAAPAVTPVQAVPVQMPKAAPAEKPVGIWGWIGIFVLINLPIVNIIMTIIWACAAKNRTLKNFARAIVVLTLVCIVLCLALMLVLALTGKQLPYINSGNYMQYFQH